MLSKSSVIVKAERRYLATLIPFTTDDQDAIAYCDPIHFGSDLIDNARDFMSKRYLITAEVAGLESSI
jgi:hypothetical protein